MAHQVGDIIEMAYVGQCEGQRVMNVWHYVVLSSTSQASDIADNASLAGYIKAMNSEGQITHEYLDCLPSNYNLDYVRAQKIAPTRSQHARSLAGFAGTSGFVANNTNTCAVITKQGQTGTRRAIGSMHLGPLPEGSMDLGFISETQIQRIDNFIQQFRNQQTVPVNNITYRPVIYNPGATPNHQFISGYLYQTEIRIVRRRTVGQGI